MTVLAHKHLIIRGKVLNPISDADSMTAWLKGLIDKIGMEIMMGPYAAREDMVGNEGVTGVAIITTSHISIHIWDRTGEIDINGQEVALVQMDVYSCKDFDISDIFDHLQSMQPIDVQYKFIDRETGLQTLGKGEWGSS